MAKDEDDVNSEFHDAIEICKRNTEKYFEDILDETKQKIEELKQTAATTIEDASKNGHVKKDLEKIVNEHVEAIKSIEQGVVKTLNNSLKESKTQIQGVYNSSTTALANSLIFDNMKLTANLFDQTLKRYISIIHEFAQEAIKYVKAIPKETKKAEASSSNDE